MVQKLWHCFHCTH